MPVITIDGPKMNKKQKAKLVKAYAETASEIMEIPVEAMVIIYTWSWRGKCWGGKYTTVW